MTDSPVVVHRAGSVLTIRLNQPERMNSFTAQSKALLLEALAEARDDDSVRVVVITGTGRAFSAGQDISEMSGLSGAAGVEQGVADFYAPVVLQLTSMPKPVLAALNGTAVGAGLALALACDLRVAAESARFGTGFAGIGLSCDTGLSWTMPRIVGRAAALDLLLRARMIDAAEAMRLGLIGEMVPDDDFEHRVDEIAAELAAGPTLAFASMKESVLYAETSTLDEALAFETQRMVTTFASGDHHAARAAFLAKRKPTFTGS